MKVEDIPNGLAYILAGFCLYYIVYEPGIALGVVLALTLLSWLLPH